MRSTHRLPFLLSAGIAGLMLAALPLGLDSSTLSPVVSQAWAGAENGHGNGHGNANGHDKQAEHADSQGADSDDDADASDLGALNAAHASDTALAHANPNSRVGKIAAYKEAELAAKAAAADAATADQAVADAQTAVDTDQANLDKVTAEANADGMVTTDEQNAINAAQDQLDADTATLTQAQSDAATVDAAAQKAQDDADAALVNASNKDITDDDGNVFSSVRDAVNNLLGID
ncbi:MAG TPA: hypothetical protein VLV76_08000 [Candidatus Acidoferrum sp.]|nr:hypothetical protein [Candidatus Acidoferrum sp.]